MGELGLTPGDQQKRVFTATDEYTNPLVYDTRVNRVLKRYRSSGLCCLENSIYWSDFW